MSTYKEISFDFLADCITKKVKPQETDIAVYYGLEHLNADSIKIQRSGTPDEVIGEKIHALPGDIIFGKRRAYQRKLGVTDCECIASAHSMVLRAKPENVVPEFLPYFMQSDVFMERAVMISEGSLSPTIKWKTLAQEKFMIPDTDSQREIAELMIAFDDSIEEKRNIINSLNMTKTKISSFDTENTKFTTFGEMFHLRRELTETTNEQIKYVALEHIESKAGNLLSFGKASEAVSIKSKFYMSDILFGKLRPYLRKYWIATDEGVCSTEILVLTCKEICITQFGFYALQNEDFIQFTINNSFGTKMPRVSWEKLSEFRMYLPNKSEQKRIVDELEKVDKLIDEVKLNINSLSQMKNRISKKFIIGGDHQ